MHRLCGYLVHAFLSRLYITLEAVHPNVHLSKCSHLVVQIQEKGQ